MQRIVWRGATPGHGKPFPIRFNKRTVVFQADGPEFTAEVDLDDDDIRAAVGTKEMREQFPDRTFYAEIAEKQEYTKEEMFNTIAMMEDADVTRRINGSNDPAYVEVVREIAVKLGRSEVVAKADAKLSIMPGYHGRKGGGKKKPPPKRKAEETPADEGESDTHEEVDVEPGEEPGDDL